MYNFDLYFCWTHNNIYRPLLYKKKPKSHNISTIAAMLKHVVLHSFLFTCSSCYPDCAHLVKQHLQLFLLCLLFPQFGHEGLKELFLCFLERKTNQIKSLKKWLFHTEFKVDIRCLTMCLKIMISGKHSWTTHTVLIWPQMFLVK